MSAYSNRHNIKPVTRNFTRGANRALLDEGLSRIYTVAAAHLGGVTGMVQLAKITSAQVRFASKQQGEEAFYTNSTG